MAKKPEPAKKPAGKAPPKKTTAVAIKREGGLPASLRDRAKADAGKGVSSLAEDNLIPLIYILTTNSPQASQKNPAYIEGAKPGSIWLRGAEDPIIDGDEGALFQACYFGKEWLEWLPERGGFAGRHDRRPKEAKQYEDPERKGRMRWKMPNGNDLVESRFYAGFVWRPGEERAMPYILPFKGTGHSVARDWMSQMNSKFDAGGEAPDPIWLHVWQITSQWKQNDAGEWYLPQIGYVGPISSEAEYDRGQKLNAAFTSGAVRAQVDDSLDQGAPAEDAEM